MEQHALEGTKSEVGQRRVPGTNRRAQSASTRTTKRTTVGGREGITSAPPMLDQDAGAAWLELRGQLASVLDDADAAMLEVAAVALGRFRAARRLVNAGGLLVEGRFEQMVENPAFKIERDAATMLHRAMVELGIGPSARARFSGVGVDGLAADQVLDGVGELVALQGGRS